MSPAAAIATAGLSKRYGATMALDHLGLLIGLHRPTAGRAELFCAALCVMRRRDLAGA